MKKKKGRMADFHLKVAYRHIRGAERTINRIIEAVFPGEKIHRGSLSDEEFDMKENKEEIVASYATGMDYLVERLENLIQSNGYNNIGNNGNQSNSSGND